MTSDGDQLKADGMAYAEAGALLWSLRARWAIEWLADQHVEFTSENLTNLVGLPRGRIGKDRNNAVGAAISAAARRRTIRRVRYEKATRPGSHSAVVGVWIGTHNQENP